MKLWPEPSSTVVSARRVVSAGTLKPLSRIEPSLDNSLTSGRTRIEMRPSARTIGVKARPTPYCLYSIVTEPRLLRDRDREFAAGEEAGGFARQRGQVRLGQRRDQAVGFGQVERAEDVEAEQLAGERRASVPPRRDWRS